MAMGVKMGCQKPSTNGGFHVMLEVSLPTAFTRHMGKLTMQPTQQEIPLAPMNANALRKQVMDCIRELLQSKVARQPGAGEVLGIVQGKCGWEARVVFLAAIQALREDHALPGYNRDYLRQTLTDEVVEAALVGDAKVIHDTQSAVDELFQRSQAYRSTKGFQEMLQFMARFRKYAPFNNMLVRLQNPACGYYATARHWQTEFGARIKEDARPMLILAPAHPVLLVYDLDSVENPPLPEHLREFALVTGEWEEEALPRLLGNAKRDRIQVDFKPLSATNAGKATTQVQTRGWKLRVVIHDGLDNRARFSVLLHELAHIYLGHLGGDGDGWWPCRTNLSLASVEVEAESVAYIVCERFGLHTTAAQYLAAHSASGKLPGGVSVEMIGKVASRLLEAASRLLPERKAGKLSEKERLGSIFARRADIVRRMREKLGTTKPADMSESPHRG
jgi:hypothetical protein